ncbi:MAG: BrnA antitoxin family protein, partial [Pyrinomonadaceae bacterium]
MKNKTKDIDDEIDFSEAAFKKRFRRITEDELPKPVKMLREAAQNKTKDRVTIYFDSDIVKRFREMAETQGVGYQTLMNEALRSAVDGSPH